MKHNLKCFTIFSPYYTNRHKNNVVLIFVFLIMVIVSYFQVSQVEMLILCLQDLFLIFKDISKRHLLKDTKGCFFFSKALKLHTGLQLESLVTDTFTNNHSISPHNFIILLKMYHFPCTCHMPSCHCVLSVSTVCQLYFISPYSDGLIAHPLLP